MAVLDVDELLARPLKLDWGGRKSKAQRVEKPRTEGDAEVEEASEADIERALTLARALPPSVEGHGGDLALYHAASELATVLPENAEAIEYVLLEAFNPRCSPPWPVKKLTREAERAALRSADPAARYARRVEARAQERKAIAAPAGECIDWLSPIEPINWYCEGLAIAPSERKVTLIGGNPGAGKGPLANYLAVCFALGLRAFGLHKCKRARVGILDFEGARLSRRRIHTYLRGFKRTPQDLVGRLLLRDTDPSEMLDLAWLQAWVQENKIEVLIIDSYMSATSAFGCDPNSPEYAELARELGALNIVVLVVAHARKPSSTSRGERPMLGDIAGSFALGGMAATGIALWRPDEDDPLTVRVGCMRAPEEPFATFDLQWERTGAGESQAWRGVVAGEVTRESREANAAAQRREEHDGTLTRAVRRVLAHLSLNPAHPQTNTAITRGTGVHHTQVGEVLGALARQRWVYHQPDPAGRSAGTWLLADTCPASLAIVEGEAVADGPPGARERDGPFRRTG